MQELDRASEPLIKGPLSTDPGLSRFAGATGSLPGSFTAGQAQAGERSNSPTAGSTSLAATSVPSRLGNINGVVSGVVGSAINATAGAVRSARGNIEGVMRERARGSYQSLGDEETGLVHADGEEGHQEGAQVPAAPAAVVPGGLAETPSLQKPLF